MSAPTPIGKFRDRMNMFLNRLDSWATSEQAKELEKFRIKYDAGMKINPRDTVALFISSIEPYTVQIMEGDEAFFIETEFDVDPEYTVLCTQLRNWWPGLDEDTRRYVKDQFKLLLMLGAIALKHEPIREVINMYRDPNNPLIY